MGEFNQIYIISIYKKKFNQIYIISIYKKNLRLTKLHENNLNIKKSNKFQYISITNK